MEIDDSRGRRHRYRRRRLQEVDELDKYDDDDDDDEEEEELLYFTSSNNNSGSNGTLDSSIYDWTNTTSNDSNISSTPPIEPKLYSRKGYVFLVDGQCRDCQVSEAGSFNLFDALLHRALTERFASTMGKSNNVLQRTNRRSKRGLQENTNTTLCTCPIEIEVPQLSKTIFSTSFNDTIQEQVDQFLFKNVVVAIENLQEGQQVLCDGELQNFTSTVFVDLSVKELGSTQTAILENAFKSSYNELTFSRCDGYHRRVAGVSLQLEDSADPFIEQRSLQDDELDLGMFGNITNITVANNSTLPNDTYFANATVAPLPPSRAAVFSITGSCRGCPVSDAGSFTLFDEAFRRERSLKSMQHQAFGARTLQASLTDTCVCLIGLKPNDEGISAQDFTVLYNAKIVEDAEEANVDIIDSFEFVVDNLLEGQKVECGSNISDFSSQGKYNQPCLFSSNNPLQSNAQLTSIHRCAVFSDLTINLTSVTTKEVMLIEEAFLRTYNNLAFSSCDGFFRETNRNH